MANEGSVSGAMLPVWRSRFSLADAGFLSLLLLVFVGLSPFEIRDANALLHGADTVQTGAGNLPRQICYLAVFALTAFAAFRESGFRAMRALPVTLLLLLSWCLASALWTVEPIVTMRRAVLECIVVAAIFLSVDTLGTDRSVRLFRWVLAGVLIVNFVSIALVPQAVHLTGEADPGLVGDWRGLYFHKNIAGAVSAISALVFFFTFLESRRWADAALFVGAAIFTVMTHSKTSIGLLPVALGFGAIYRLAWRRPLDRRIALVALTLMTFVGLVALALQWTAISHLLANPGELTGRAEIWRAESAFIADHPMLGSGFGSFADTGAASPLHRYIGSAWIANISHGHSGYLQLLVSVGSVGFVLGMLALIVLPAAQLLNADAESLGLKGLLFAIFVFILLHNVLETDFLEADGAAWVAFLIALAMLRTIAKGKT